MKNSLLVQTLGFGFTANVLISEAKIPIAVRYWTMLKLERSEALATSLLLAFNLGDLKVKSRMSF